MSIDFKYEIGQHVYWNDKLCQVLSRSYMETTKNIIIKYNLKDGENFYYIEDSQKNYFIIKQKDVFNFEIYLDCYTIETEAENYIYNQLKQANKVLYNARNIIDSINTEDYDYLYSHVDNIENEKEQYVKYLRNYISDSALKVQKEELSVNSKKYEYIATLQDKNDSIKSIKINIELQQDIRFLIKIVMD